MYCHSFAVGSLSFVFLAPSVAVAEVLLVVCLGVHRIRESEFTRDLKVAILMAYDGFSEKYGFEVSFAARLQWQP